jgi:hypothetical protein
MVTAYVMDIPQSSHDTASIIDLVRKIYTKSATFLPKIKFALAALILIPTLIIISIPLWLILLSLMKVSKIRLCLALRKEIKISFDTYANAKEIQSSLIEDIRLIKDVIDLLDSKSILFATVFIDDIKDTYKILSNFQQKLDNSLVNLSKGQVDGQYFKMISEDTIWNNRVKAYQYIL